MDIESDSGQPTRLLFIGDERLADGFRLIGFEAYPNPEPGEVDRLFRDLIRSRERAYVLIDDLLMAQDIPNLRRVRREGGRIVVVGVPPLNAPVQLSSEVAQRLTALFGGAALDTQPSAHPRA